MAAGDNGTAAPPALTKTQGRVAHHSSFGALPGMARPEPGTYEVYRDMLCNPTIAFVRAVVFGTMKSAAWSCEEKDDAPAGATELVQDFIDRQRCRLLNDGLRCQDYGWQPFEKVWGLRDGAQVIDRCKPLLPDISHLLLDEQTGEFRGVRNTGADLEPTKCVVVTYDGEAGDLYGRSRLENVRKTAWRAWKDTLDKFGQYTTKGASVIPVVQHPEGSGRDATGALVDSFEIAKGICDSLSQARGIAMPIRLLPWMQNFLDAGVDPTKLMAWTVTFLESRAGHGAEFVASLGHFDKWLVRGYLMPERAIMEGQHGTKAEAGEHGDVGVMICEQTLGEVVEQVNEQVVDDMLVANYGPDAKGTVYIKAAPLQDKKRAFIADVMKQVMTNPANIDLVLGSSDVDAILDILDWPKGSETVEAPVLPTPDPEKPEKKPVSASRNPLTSTVAALYNRARLRSKA